ncbi:hypothetical protein AGMMS49938_01360 [Fibrobacterales bacterium]|nr:hypothetical protein AGMMS49938_01360 [Fibrobacterales bacterium]
MKKLTLFLLGFAVCAFADDDSLAVQKSLLQKLDSIQETVIGFAIDGKAKGGVLTSVMSSKALPQEESVSEYNAFTDFLLNLSVSPSVETRARFDLRFHKDWQNAYREGNNSPIVRWWSYDGNILDKHLKFNIGTMRLSYTPLTIYLPEPEFIFEPEIFAEQRKEAMEERYLDGTNRRLLQGLNAEFNYPFAFFDKFGVQGSVLRLRKNQNAEDRIFYDFDPHQDRYGAGVRFGVEAFGVGFGINDVYVFDRKSSTTKTSADSALFYEKNNVLSFELGFNSKKMLDSPVKFGVGAEYALSNYSYDKAVRYTVVDSVLAINGIGNLIPSNTSPGLLDAGEQDSINRYPTYTTKESYKYKYGRIEKLANKGALLANAFVSFEQGLIEAKLKGHFLKTDKGFESELAASPAFLPSLPILNSNGELNSVLSQFRNASLENLYYSLYYTLPMNLYTIIQGKMGTPDDIFSNSNGNFVNNNGYLYNNYKFSQYYRNAYTQQTFTRTERDSVANRLDPSVNLALPYGYATPDRKGGDADLYFAFNDAVKVKGVFGSYSSENGDYTNFGGGLSVDVARLADFSRALEISGSYEQSKEEKGQFNPTVNRIMAGAKVGIWRGLSLLCAFQTLDKEFENPYLGLAEKTSEMLVLGGPQIKISERAVFNLQGGLLSNSITATDGTKLSIDKYLASGIVSVEF